MQTEGNEVTPTRAGRRRPVAASLLGIALLAAACGPPESEEIAGWDASDESNVERIDHAPWQDILDVYVDPDPSNVNLVDYAALAANAGGCGEACRVSPVPGRD